MTTAINPAARSVLDRISAICARRLRRHPSRAATGNGSRYHRDQLDRSAELSKPLLPLPRVQDHSIEGPDEPLASRLYRPAPGVMPARLYYHGSGFIGGSLASRDPALQALAHASGWLVAAVAYRLAPAVGLMARDRGGSALWLQICL